MMMPPPLRLCIAIVWSTFALSKTDASLFGVPSTAVSNLTSLRPKSALSHIHEKMRGGGDGEKKDAVLPTSRPYLPYTLAIRDSIMIAHSFHGHPSFGPAGGMHGATYTVDVEFASASLHPECNWVIDIGVASDLLAEVLKKYNYKNLDELFGEGVMTTTEFMCKTIHNGIVEKLKEKYDKEGDENGFKGWFKVSLWESHKAWASYEGPSS
mmetsp:Transcript_27443/g.57279  ORF Transcript_27443/g.57279 Transcript_27443/m.57279 type:complete len:211 (+) Transcript_27443:25-657(+)|eukprot:CAMPEP_0196143796 /NCGR_PEP_ID=MMETSP0910-20130528/13718_1 /TAXON_ID=49265 /ORGANISM="Thalassiosira rotula, Strain GSO102" /LENGTH=210 /DNA_ID=CAMNT_0041405283 /DNA_START=24 /DNA_END=656 /DNA_ORIENTATION=-